MKCGINRDWLGYWVQFVQRDEFYLDLNRLDNWKQEINQMNQRSPANHIESVYIIRYVMKKIFIGLIQLLIKN
jgi:hypothetical protein